MAAEGTSQTSCFTQNPSLITANSVFGFSPNDNLGLQILLHRLNGNHFLQWSQAVQLFLGVKKKTALSERVHFGARSNTDER
jgi:LTR polyprotein gag-polypeptide-like protein